MDAQRIRVLVKNNKYKVISLVDYFETKIRQKKPSALNLPLSSI